MLPASLHAEEAFTPTPTHDDIDPSLLWRALLVSCLSSNHFTDVGFPSSLPSASASTAHVTPTIVHLSIRWYALPSDDPSLSKKKRLSVAFGRRLSTAAVGVGVGVGGARDGEQEGDGEVRRTGCCGCTIC